MKIALLVIDMQNAFKKAGGFLEVKGIRDVIEPLKEFINQIRTKNVPTIFSRHCFDSKKNPIEAALFPDKGMEELKRGSLGWEIIGDLEPKNTDPIIDKYRYDAFFKTDLREILHKLEIDTVIITGTMTNICCESTARTAMFYDFNVVFCEDLTFCSDLTAQENTLKVMRTHFGKVMKSSEIVELCDFHGSNS